MSYWTKPTDLVVQGERGLAGNMNTLFDGIETGFDAVETDIGTAIDLTNAEGKTLVIADTAMARSGEELAFDASGNLVSQETQASEALSAATAANGYQDKIAERAYNTSYTNTNDYPIYVASTGRVDTVGGSGYAQTTAQILDPTGSTIVFSYLEHQYTVNEEYTMTLLVPPSFLYRILNTGAGTTTLLNWMELT